MRVRTTPKAACCLLILFLGVLLAHSRVLELVADNAGHENEAESLENESDEDNADGAGADGVVTAADSDGTSSIMSWSHAFQENNDENGDESNASDKSEYGSGDTDSLDNGSTLDTSEDVESGVKEENPLDGSSEGYLEQSNPSDDSVEPSASPQEADEVIPSSLPGTVPFLNLFWATPEASGDDAPEQPTESPANPTAVGFEATPGETVGPTDQNDSEASPDGFQEATEDNEPHEATETDNSEASPAGYSYVEEAVFETDEESHEGYVPYSSPVPQVYSSVFTPPVLVPAVSQAETPAVPSEKEAIPSEIDSCRSTYPSLATFVENCLLLGVGATGQRFQSKCCNFLRGWVGPGAPGEGCVCDEVLLNDASDALTNSAMARIFGVDSAFMSDVFGRCSIPLFPKC